MNRLLNYTEKYHKYYRGLNVKFFKQHPCRVYKFWLNATAVWQWQLPHS